MASIDPTRRDAKTGKPARDTKWRARYRDPAGRSRSRTFDRKADAERFLASSSTDMERGAWVDPRLGKITLAAWTAEYLATAANLRPLTLQTYRRDLDKYVLPRFGRVPLARLSPVEIRAWLADELAAGIAPSSVHRHYRTLRRVLQVAVDSELLVKNPCLAVQAPRIPSSEIRFLTAGEVVRLADEHMPRWRPLLFTSAYAGLRWSESVGLRAKNVDLLRRKITVAEQLVQLDDGSFVRQEPKTRAGVRTVSIPPFLAEMLQEQLDRWAQPGPDGLVFPNSAGNPLVQASFQSNVFKPATRRAGVAPLRWHDLRHTAVALAIGQGAHPKAIQQRMGHSSVTMTLDRYGHLFPEIDEAIADGLQAAFDGSAADDGATVRSIAAGA